MRLVHPSNFVGQRNLFLIFISNSILIGGWLRPLFFPSSQLYWPVGWFWPSERKGQCEQVNKWQTLDTTTLCTCRGHRPGMTSCFAHRKSLFTDRSWIDPAKMTLTTLALLATCMPLATCLFFTGQKYRRDPWCPVGLYPYNQSFIVTACPL